MFFDCRMEGQVGGEYDNSQVPLRKIDQILPPNCPCCNITKRFTIAILASIGKSLVHSIQIPKIDGLFAGFLISFGIRCNMGVAVMKMTANSTITGVSISLFQREVPYLSFQGILPWGDS